MFYHAKFVVGDVTEEQIDRLLDMWIADVESIGAGMSGAFVDSGKPDLVLSRIADTINTAVRYQPDMTIPWYLRKLAEILDADGWQWTGTEYVWPSAAEQA